MSDKLPTDDAEEENGEETLIVPPPGFRERLLAAQKARTSEIRQSVEIPNPMKKAEEPAPESAPVPEQPASQPVAQPASKPTSKPALVPPAASVGEPAQVGKRKSQPSMELSLPRTEADETPAQN
jgi:hypothetical protein